MTSDDASVPHLQSGANAEKIALDYLKQQGLTPVTRNYRCQQGELDLIMQDGQTLVVVEVRFRKSEQFGGALQSITRHKQSRIIAATGHYLMKNNIQSPVRFDVIAINGQRQINWIKHAFQS